MKHIIVHKKPGMFYGWPANNGVWSWGNEIAVGFTEAHYLEKADSHSQDNSRPKTSLIARSVDGGESWKSEYPENYSEGFSFGNDDRPPDAPIGVLKPLNFLDPNMAIRCRNGHFLVSHDRCRTWHGPYWFPTFDLTAGLTARTDYIVLDAGECLFFVSVKDGAVQSGIQDRAFAIRTTDGGMSFDMQGWMLPDHPEIRSVMPATVQVGDDHLVSALRRRFDHSDGPTAGFKECWIDTADSKNRGRTWEFLSRIADTHSRESQHNGNPPSLVNLPDGRLCVVYGYRAPPCGIRAKISADRGLTGGSEIVLRDDARSWDIGYPRSVARSDGRIVSVYYYTTTEFPEQHIAATIWNPIAGDY